MEKIKEEIEKIIRDGKKKAEFLRWGELVRYLIVAAVVAYAVYKGSSGC